MVRNQHHRSREDVNLSGIRDRTVDWIVDSPSGAVSYFYFTFRTSENDRRRDYDRRMPRSRDIPRSCVTFNPVSRIIEGEHKAVDMNETSVQIQSFSWDRPNLS